jgi:hypothetical protein
MLRNPAFATTFVTVYLIIYTVLFHTGAPEAVITAMFAASPFLVIWMAITIMRFGKYSGRELDDNEEWGYQDVNKNDL